jgi:hypothetical protein
MSATLLRSAPLAAARPAADASTRARWTGRVLSGLAAAFLGMNALVGLLARPEAVEGTRALGPSSPRSA